MVTFELNTPINVFSSKGWQGKRKSTIKVVSGPTEIKVALLSADTLCCVYNSTHV